MAKELPESKGVLLEESDIFGEQAFRATAVARFPDLEPQLAGFEGLHVAMGVLRAAARDAIDAGDFDRMQSIFQLLQDAISHPDAVSEIENAVAISFLAPAELRDSANGRRALELMPAAVRDPILEAERREAEGAERKGEVCGLTGR